MRWLAGIAFVLQVLWVIGGSLFTPDYYSRSPESVLAWAHSSGVWVVGVSVGLAAASLVAALRLKRSKPVAMAVVSWAFAVVWLFHPYLYSVLADGVFHRFS